MAAKRTSQAKPGTGRNPRTLKQSLLASAVFTGRFVFLTTARSITYCRENLFSIVLLLMFPLAIGAYYWGNSTAEQAPPPKYLMMDEDEKSTAQDSKPAQSEQAPLVTVVPEATVTAPTPQLFTFPTEEELAELTLPISADGPELVATSSPDPAPAWHLQQLPEPKLTRMEMDCVWFTGTIEVFESSPEILQNATRVHELTGPSRN